MSDPTTRRFFLGALTAASAVRVMGANDKVTVGIVGLGGRGSSHLNTYTGLSEAQVVGLCDVNQAARVVARAGGGEVLVTRAVVEQAAGVDGLQFERIGEVRLKGFSEASELFIASSRKG